MAKAVEIARCPSMEEAIVLTGCLEAHGIPAKVADFYASSYCWEFSANEFGRVLVPECEKEKARQLILDRMVVADTILTDEFGGLEPDIQRRDRLKVWLTVLFFGLHIMLAFGMILIAIERFRRGEPILGFRKVQRRTDRLFAPFPTRKSVPVNTSLNPGQN